MTSRYDHYDEEGPGEHDAHLLDDEGNDYAPCPSCGRDILAVADRCHRCGARFNDEAWTAAPGGERSILWLLVAAVLLAVIVALVWAGLW